METLALFSVIPGAVLILYLLENQMRRGSTFVNVDNISSIAALAYLYLCLVRKASR